MTYKLIGILVTIFCVMACSDEDPNCFKCVQESNMENVIELCEEQGINYTDTNGNEIEFNELSAHYEDIGYNCD